MILVFLASLMVTIPLLCRYRVPEMFRNLQSPTSADLYMIPPAGTTDPQSFGHSELTIRAQYIHTLYTYVYFFE